MNTTNNLDKLIDKEVTIFYNSGGRVFRCVGKVKSVDEKFLIINDYLQGECYISVDSITKIDSFKNVKGGEEKEENEV